MLHTSLQSVVTKMDKQIDPQKLVKLIKEDQNIVNTLERLKTSLPSYISGFVGEETLVNLYLGLPNKTIQVFLIQSGELESHTEDAELFAKMKHKYIIEKNEFIAKRYVNRVLDSITRVSGVEIDYESRVKGDINAVEQSIELHWVLASQVNNAGFELSPKGIHDMLTQDSGEISCASIYCDTDYGIHGEAQNDFTVNHLNAHRVSPKQIDSMWNYIAKGINVNKDFAEYIGEQYHHLACLGALAMAVATKQASQDDVGDFMMQHKFNPRDVVIFRQWANTKLKFAKD